MVIMNRWLGLGMVILTVGMGVGLSMWWESVVRESVLDDPLPTILPFPPPKLEGVYAPNSLLHHILKIGEGLLPTPEDLAFDSKTGFLYAACGDGWIKRINLFDEHLKVDNWTFVGGRPLGIVVGNYGELLVCEPFQGLLNVTENNVQILADEVDGKKIIFADGLDVSKDGSVYFTDASTKYGLAQANYDSLEGRPNGRLLKYSPITNTTTVLATNLYFPNGVALSGDQKFFVFCETAKTRCSKYWLEGDDKKGQREIFIENLPGYPDNVRYNNNGIFWIGIVYKRSAVMELLWRIGQVKHMVVGMKSRMEKLNAGIMSMGKVLGVKEEDGSAVYMYEDPSGEAIPYVTTGLQVGEYLYLGGLGSSHIGRLHLNISSNANF